MSEDSNGLSVSVSWRVAVVSTGETACNPSSITMGTKSSGDSLLFCLGRPWGFSGAGIFGLGLTFVSGGPENR